MSSVQDWLHTAVETGGQAVATSKKALKKSGKQLKKARKAAKKGGHDAQVWAHEYADHIGEPRTWAPLAMAGVAGFAAGVAVLGARKAAMQAMTSVAGDWFATLKADHKLVEKLFELVNKTEEHDTAKRTLLLAKVTYALVKHTLEEENVIYPALRGVDQEMAAKHLAAEHFDIKTYLHELAEMPKDDPRWMATMRSLQTLVKSHVREEEQDIYPAFHAKMTKEQNTHLTLAMNREGIKVA